MATPRRRIPWGPHRGLGSISSSATSWTDATGGNEDDSDATPSDSQGGWSLAMPTSTGYGSPSTGSRSRSVSPPAARRSRSSSTNRSASASATPGPPSPADVMSPWPRHRYLLAAFLEGRELEGETQLTGSMGFERTAAQVLQNEEHAGLRSFLDAGRRGVNEHLVLRLPPPLHHQPFVQAVFGSVSEALDDVKQRAVPVMAPLAGHWPSQPARRAEHLLAGLCYCVLARCRIPDGYFPPELAGDLDRAASGFDDEFRRAALWAMLRTMLVSDAGPYSRHACLIMVGFCAPPTDAELEVLRDVVGFLRRTERPLKLMLIVGEDVAFPFDTPLSVPAILKDNPSLVASGLEADLMQWYSSAAEDRSWFNTSGVKRTLLPVLKRDLAADPLLAISYLMFSVARLWTTGTGLKRDRRLCATRLDLIRMVLEAVSPTHRPLADHVLGITAFSLVSPLASTVSAIVRLDGGPAAADHEEQATDGSGGGDSDSTSAATSDSSALSDGSPAMIGDGFVELPRDITHTFPGLYFTVRRLYGPSDGYRPTPGAPTGIYCRLPEELRQALGAPPSVTTVTKDRNGVGGIELANAADLRPLETEKEIKKQDDADKSNSIGSATPDTASAPAVAGLPSWVTPWPRSEMRLALQLLQVVQRGTHPVGEDGPDGAVPTGNRRVPDYATLHWLDHFERAYVGGGGAAPEAAEIERLLDDWSLVRGWIRYYVSRQAWRRIAVDLSGLKDAGRFLSPRAIQTRYEKGSHRKLNVAQAARASLVATTVTRSPLDGDAELAVLWATWVLFGPTPPEEEGEEVGGEETGEEEKTQPPPPPAVGSRPEGGRDPSARLDLLRKVLPLAPAATLQLLQRLDLKYVLTNASSLYEDGLRLGSRDVITHCQPLLPKNGKGRLVQPTFRPDRDAQLPSVRYVDTWLDQLPYGGGVALAKEAGEESTAKEVAPEAQAAEIGPEDDHDRGSSGETADEPAKMAEPVDTEANSLKSGGLECEHQRGTEAVALGPVDLGDAAPETRFVFWLWQSILLGDVMVVRRLLDLPLPRLDVDGQDGHLPISPPLVLATRLGLLPMVEMLLAARDSGKHTLSIHTEDQRGFTPLYTAALHGFAGIARALLAAGASAVRGNSGGTKPTDTPLHAAVRMGNAAMLRLLMASRDRDPELDEGRGAMWIPGDRNQSKAAMRRQEQEEARASDEAKAPGEGPSRSRSGMVGNSDTDDSSDGIGPYGRRVIRLRRRSFWRRNSDGGPEVFEVSLDGCDWYGLFNEAAEHGEPSLMEALLDGIEPARQAQLANVFLPAAAKANGVGTLRYLLAIPGVNVNNGGSQHGETALHMAAGAGNVEAVKLLFEAGAETWPLTVFNLSPLRMPNARLRPKIVRLFVAQVESRRKRWAAAHQEQKKVEIRRKSTGSDESGGPTAALRSWAGNTLRAARATAGDDEKVARLGESDDDDGRDSGGSHNEAATDSDEEEDRRHLSEALLTAARKGEERSAALLLDAGADKNYRNAHGDTPLHWATGLPPSYLRQTESPRQYAVLRLLVQRHAALDAPNNRGDTALHQCARWGYVRGARLLLDAGASLYVVADQTSGNRPLQDAALADSPAVVALLLERGAPVEPAPRQPGRDLLEQMVRLGNMASLAVLLDHAGGVIDAARLSELSHVAMRQDRTRIMRRLIQRGGDPDSVSARNGFGTALHECAWSGNVKMASVVLERYLAESKKERTEAWATRGARAASGEERGEDDAKAATTTSDPSRGGNSGEGGSPTRRRRRDSVQGHDSARESEPQGPEADDGDVESGEDMVPEPVPASLSIPHSPPLLSNPSPAFTRVRARPGPTPRVNQFHSSSFQALRSNPEAAKALNLVAGEFGTPLIAAVCRAEAPIPRHRRTSKSYRRYVERRDGRKRRMLVFLMKSGADPTVAGGCFGTLLGAAALRAPVDTLGFVLAKGPGDSGAGLPVTLTDREGRNAAHMAAVGFDSGDAQDTIDKLDLLTGYDGGATLLGALDHVGRRPLHFAAASRRTAGVLYLLERGEDAHINDADADGWTPLHWACREWAAEVVLLLVSRGADRSLRTAQGWLPWHVAIYHQNENLEDALMAHGTPAEPGKPTAPAVKAGYWCSSCFVDIFGERWNCDQCTNFDHCFKCHGTAAKTHETDHTFTYHAPLEAGSDGGSVKEDGSEAEKEESDTGSAES